MARVIQGHRQQPFDRVRTTSFLTLIESLETMRLSCTVFVL